MTAWQSRPKKKKYFSNETMKSSLTDGRSFSSQLERTTYLWLKAKEQNGELTIEACQDSVHLSAARILYRPDFRVRDSLTGEVYWVEAKGFETTDWRIKRRLWISYGPGRLEIVKGSGTRISVYETLTPDSPALDQATRGLE